MLVLVSARDDLVNEKILYSHSMHSANPIRYWDYWGIVVFDVVLSIGWKREQKISYGTTSNASTKFRDRLHSLIEARKKRLISSLKALTRIFTAMLSQQLYPNVFDLNETSFYANTQSIISWWTVTSERTTTVATVRNAIVGKLLCSNFHDWHIIWELKHEPKGFIHSLYQGKSMS